MKRRDFTKSMLGIFGAVMLAPEVFVGELVPVPIGTIVTTAGPLTLRQLTEAINNCSGWQAWQYGEDDEPIAVADATPITIVPMPFIEDEDGNRTYTNLATCSIDESGSLTMTKVNDHE